MKLGMKHIKSNGKLISFLKLRKVRKYGFALVASLGVGVAGLILSGNNAANASGVQDAIAQEIIRFHVLANSDSEQDQQLKLKVKAVVVSYMEELLADANGIEESRKLIQDHLKEIEKVAKDMITKEGYYYSVTAQLGDTYFPIKTYGDMTFPAGEYEALQIKIGDAKGQNWWCVLYPNLCFVDATHAVVPEEQKKMLKEVLTEEEYNSLENENVEVKIKFKFLEDWFR